MGTRGLTAVFLDGKHRVAQYGQWDHYPEGQGFTALEFCRDNLTTKRGRKKFAKAVDQTRFLADGEREKLWEKCGADMDPKRNPHGLVSMDVSKKFAERYPQLHRDTGAKILSMVAEGATELDDSLSFARESLFCEWAYCVNLDAGTLEVYKGFQQGNAGRGEGSLGYLKREPGEKYTPVALVKAFPLNRLPSQVRFLAEVVVASLDPEPEYMADSVACLIGDLREEDLSDKQIRKLLYRVGATKEQVQAGFEDRKRKDRERAEREQERLRRAN